ncbi:MAG: hypothetical protein IPK88_07760 [Saprospiraceae bacterium]|nr:hypothetical protein [Candidatus Defluviibacterium haderslevense]
MHLRKWISNNPLSIQDIIQIILTILTLITVFYTIRAVKVSERALEQQKTESVQNYLRSNTNDSLDSIKNNIIIELAKSQIEVLMEQAIIQKNNSQYMSEVEKPIIGISRIRFICLSENCQNMSFNYQIKNVGVRHSKLIAIHEYFFDKNFGRMKYANIWSDKILIQDNTIERNPAIKINNQMKERFNWDEFITIDTFYCVLQFEFKQIKPLIKTTMFSNTYAYRYYNRIDEHSSSEGIFNSQIFNLKECNYWDSERLNIEVAKYKSEIKNLKIKKN